MALSCCKKISALLHKKTSNHKSDFYCLNSFMKENKLQIHDKIFNNKRFCRVKMLSEEKKNIKI